MTEASLSPPHPAARLIKGAVLAAEERVAALRIEAGQLENAIVEQQLQIRQAAESAATEAQRVFAESQRAGFADGMGRADQLVTGFEAQMAGLRDEWSQQVQELAFELARKILDIELSIQPAMVLDLVRKLLEKARFDQTVTIVLNPLDCELVRPNREELQDSLIHAERLEFRADSALPRGSVRLDTNRGVLDGSIDVQLDRLRRLWFGPSPAETP